MSWKITQVDNGKRQYMLARHTGHKVRVSIPEAHSGESSAYLEAAMAGHDLAIEKPAKNLKDRLLDVSLIVALCSVAQVVISLILKKL